VSHFIVEHFKRMLDGKEKKFPRDTWQYEKNAIAIVRYLIEEKLEWTRKDVCNLLDGRIFDSHGLKAMLYICFGGSCYNALEAAYPGEYNPWELVRVPKGYWNVETGTKATRWLIEEKLKWSKKDVCQHLTYHTFRDNKMSSMLNTCFGESPYAALEAAYPGEYKPWELNNVPRSFWTETTCAEATKWLLEEKLKWSREEICNNLSQGTFVTHKLTNMLQIGFNGSPYGALNTVYPNEYKPWELNIVPRNFWTVETGIEATRWLFEEKLKWPIERVRQEADAKTFLEYGLRSMLRNCFEGSAQKAIDCTYPQ